MLKREGAVPLLELVLNHASFAQTVENLFSSSFLVRLCMTLGCCSLTLVLVAIPFVWIMLCTLVHGMCLVFTCWTAGRCGMHLSRSFRKPASAS